MTVPSPEDTRLATERLAQIHNAFGGVVDRGEMTWDQVYEFCRGMSAGNAKIEYDREKSV